MIVTIINETTEKKVEEFYDDFQNLADKTQKLLKIEKDYTLSLVFVTSVTIRDINREYRNIDSSTDVISFALKDCDDGFVSEEVEKELGDILINVEAIAKQSNEYQHSYKREALFLFVHGILHLLGYDHQNDTQEKEMIKLQKEILDGEV